MNDIRPFRALRYDEAVAGPLDSLLCPPYDIISPSEQAALHNRSPFNMVRLELGYERPEDDSFNNRYRRAAKTLSRWLAEGELREDREPALYLYEQQFSHEGESLVRRGVLAALRLAPWEEGVVLPHEETMAKPKEDRLRLMRATRCNLSPLFLLFDDPSGKALELMTQAAEAPPTAGSTTEDGQVHRLWAVTGAAERELRGALEAPQLYMADGHHRYETSLAYRDEMLTADPDGSGDAAYNFVLVLLVDARDPGLVVLPTHRLVRAVDRADLARLEEAIPALFDVERVECAYDDARGVAEELLQRMRESGAEGPALGFYRKGSASLLVPRPDLLAGRESSPRPVLDVDVLHDAILEPLLGIGADELKAGSRVSFTRDAVEAVTAVNRGDAQAAFLLNPTRVEQVLGTARAQEKMPQKSTYFYPKPTTGLVIHRLTGEEGK